ncbi:hypothetical protein [Okeania sp. SIO2B3]|uniref:hypothetical protein n=1 Tax=Okeania sp. SIO2B3 TaxID=2607784 RepID=UPI0013C25CB5|nr:hypothetical protein [Okeania sp. SIO2B3]NET46717.1 hypothetical protein [Okeania sp. SIO2B3]
MACKLAFECILDKHGTCYNYSFCKDLSSPWPLPYNYERGFLCVDFNRLSCFFKYREIYIQEIQQLFKEAMKLPYYYSCDECVLTVRIVTYYRISKKNQQELREYFEKYGFADAFPLPYKYFNVTDEMGHSFSNLTIYFPFSEHYHSSYLKKIYNEIGYYEPVDIDNSIPF